MPMLVKLIFAEKVINTVGFGVRTEHKKSNDSRAWIVSPTKDRFLCM